MMAKNIFRHVDVIVNYWQTSGKLAVQLAAKKKQSINSSYPVAVLRSRRK
jgi:hypothetical protein